MALGNIINFAVPLQCQYSAIFDRFYPKMCYTVWGGVIDDEFGKRIRDIGIQKNYRRIERSYKCSNKRMATVCSVLLNIENVIR